MYMALKSQTNDLPLMRTKILTKLHISKINELNSVLNNIQFIQFFLVMNYTHYMLITNFLNAYYIYVCIVWTLKNRL